jgi:hypothetical protein
MPHRDYGVASWLRVNDERAFLPRALHLDIATVFSIRVDIAGIELTRPLVRIEIVGFASLSHDCKCVVRHCPESFPLRWSSRRPNLESSREKRWSWPGGGDGACLRRAG